MTVTSQVRMMYLTNWMIVTNDYYKIRYCVTVNPRVRF